MVKGKPTGIAFVESTSLKVFHNIHTICHRVFDGIARREKEQRVGFMALNCIYLLQQYVKR